MNADFCVVSWAKSSALIPAILADVPRASQKIMQDRANRDGVEAMMDAWKLFSDPQTIGGNIGFVNIDMKSYANDISIKNEMTFHL